jgi:hypothetical protein
VSCVVWWGPRARLHAHTPWPAPSPRGPPPALALQEYKAETGYYYNAAQRWYYDAHSRQYYGGEPADWTQNPPIPREARYEVMTRPPPPPGPAPAREGGARPAGAAAAGVAAAAAAAGRVLPGMRISATASHPQAGVGGAQMPTDGRIGGARGVGEVQAKKKEDPSGKVRSSGEQEMCACVAAPCCCSASIDLRALLADAAQRRRRARSGSARAAAGRRRRRRCRRRRSTRWRRGRRPGSGCSSAPKRSTGCCKPPTAAELLTPPCPPSCDRYMPATATQLVPAATADQLPQARCVSAHLFHPTHSDHSKLELLCRISHTQPAMTGKQLQV